MVRAGNERVIATLTPVAFANLNYIIQQTGLSKTNVVVLALKYYADLLRKEDK